MQYKLFLIVTTFFLTTGYAYAYSAIATIKGHPFETWWVASNYDSQKEADKDAISGCKANAKKNGLTKIANKCKIVNRGKGPGYGAVVCGTDGCSWTLGYGGRQEAVDAAYKECTKSHAQCQTDDITSWEDFRGFKAKNPKANSGDCRPKTQTLRCSSNCVNGNCLLTYENGCKINVQVSPKFDSFSNQWKYPSPSC